jgi:hypothetical protein
LRHFCQISLRAKAGWHREYSSTAGQGLLFFPMQSGGFFFTKSVNYIFNR